MTQHQQVTLSQAAIASIAHIRRERGLSGAQLADRMSDLGFTEMTRSVIANVETGRREYLTVDELGAFAIALNVSLIQLLTPYSGEVLVTPKTEPMAAGWLESWVRGETPWPPSADEHEYFHGASDRLSIEHDLGLSPELLELASLRSSVLGALGGTGAINQIEDAKLMAQRLRDGMASVATYVELLANRLDRDGYGRATRSTR